MNKTIGILLGIGLLLLLGCAACAPTGATLATTVDDVVGIWSGTHPGYRQQWHEDLYIEFKTDGTFRIAAAADTLEDHPDGEGEFWFEGTQFHWKDITGPVYGIRRRYSWRECAISNPTAIYEVKLRPNGNLKFARIQDKCSWRTEILTEMEWEPVR